MSGDKPKDDTSTEPKTVKERVAAMEKTISEEGWSIDGLKPGDPIPLPGLAKRKKVADDKKPPIISEADLSAPSPRTKKYLIATPGVPSLPARVITASRSKAMYRTMLYATNGKTSGIIPHSKFIAMTGDTISTFLPHYQHLVQEYGAINSLNLTKDERESIYGLLRAPKAFNRGLLQKLDNIKPGLAQVLYTALLPQYSISESGVTDNILSFGDTPLWDRLNALGLGTRFVAQIFCVLDNAQFFENIAPPTIKNKDFTLDYADKTSKNKITLIKGHVDDTAHVVSFKLDANVPPELRDLAIKHLVYMVATHTQQNNSNEFNVAFGDNPYENLRILQLAIGVYNLRVPEHLIRSYIATLDKDTKKELGDEFNFWAHHSEVFQARIASNGAKIVDENKRPTNPTTGKKMSMEAILGMLSNHVREDIFKAAAPSSEAPPPAPPSSLSPA